MIVILDYGLGNIKAFANVYNKLHIPYKIARDKDDLNAADKLILPGVGAFDHAIEMLNKSGMTEKLTELVCSNKIPILGVCVGMQILAKSSDEGSLNGMGWIDATVKIFDTSKIKTQTKLPHMGWNEVSVIRNNPLLCNLDNGSRFYFLHSYYFDCHNKGDEIAVSEYGDFFCCAVNHENVYGVQFHPEKSHHNGVRVLENFAAL